MCRLFGSLGHSKSTVSAELLASDRSLLRQADASPETRQADGWGVGWYLPDRLPSVRKGTRCAALEPDRTRFVEASEAAEPPLVLAHLRHASNPMHLAHERLIGAENCQPFTDGFVLFVHNGEISLPNETRARLGPLARKVRGVNDSEVLFWLLRKHLEGSRSPLEAYVRSVEELNAIWHEDGSAAERPYSGLNVLISRGPEELWAFCHYLGEHGSRFFDPAHPYYEMAYRSDGRAITVGSEQFDAQEPTWRSLPNGRFLEASARDGGVVVRTGVIPFAKESAETAAQFAPGMLLAK